jgi:hypothetical protein
MLAHLRLSNAQVEAAYAGSDGAGLDALAQAQPDALFSESYIALASVPSIGRQLLTDAAWQRLEPGEHALLVFYRGRYGVIGDDFIAGTAPDRLRLKQSGLPIEMRDLDLDITLLARRAKGMMYPERIDREFHATLQLPPRFVIAPPANEHGLGATWKQRGPELAILGAGLIVLTIALARQRALTAGARRFAWFRNGCLLFTALFIGWYAQGQLSIVNITGLMQALRERRANSIVETLALDGRSIATSGDYASAFAADFSRHHIFDPATGESPPELAEVTVAAPSGMLADGLSTAFMVAGSRRALALAAEMPGVDMLLVGKDGSLRHSAGMPHSA